ncbi:MAG TPA: PIN domain-containing protein [Candidatus Limnocylindrales bacterium]|nr:PIN domain-containing protein [Candidatus Limnocylindrales bacterium]
MAGEKTFVDTNVLAYAHDTSERTRQPVARARLEALWASGNGVLSTQVLQEFYVVATRKFRPPLARREVREIVSLYATWTLIQVDPTLILAAARLEERLQLSFWDALIVEAARVAGAATLLSEDLEHGRRIGGVRIEDPFRAEQDGLRSDA